MRVCARAFMSFCVCYSKQTIRGLFWGNDKLSSKMMWQEAAGKFGTLLSSPAFSPFFASVSASTSMLLNCLADARLLSSVSTLSFAPSAKGCYTQQLLQQQQQLYNNNNNTKKKSVQYTLRVGTST